MNHLIALLRRRSESWPTGWLSEEAFEIRNVSLAVWRLATINACASVRPSVRLCDRLSACAAAQESALTCSSNVNTHKARRRRWLKQLVPALLASM